MIILYWCATLARHWLSSPSSRSMVNILGRQLQASTFVTEIRFFAWGFEQIACVFFPSCVPVLCFYFCFYFCLLLICRLWSGEDEKIAESWRDDGKIINKILMYSSKETRPGGAAALALISASVSDYWTRRRHGYLIGGTESIQAERSPMCFGDRKVR